MCLPRCLAAPAAAGFGAVPGHSDQAPAATSPSGLNLGKRHQGLVIHASAEDPHQPQPAHQFSIQTHLPGAPGSPSPPARGCAAQVQIQHRLETLKHLGKEKQFLKVIGSSCYNREGNNQCSIRCFRSSEATSMLQNREPIFCRETSRQGPGAPARTGEESEDS